MLHNPAVIKQRNNDWFVDEVWQLSIATSIVSQTRNILLSPNIYFSKILNSCFLYEKLDYGLIFIGFFV